MYWLAPAQRDGSDSGVILNSIGVALIGTGAVLFWVAAGTPHGLKREPDHVDWCEADLH